MTIKKVSSVIKPCMISISYMVSIFGCGVYNSVDLADYTKNELKFKYGEEFEIVYVSNDGVHTTAYPLSDSDLLFQTEYYYNQKRGSDTYRQEKLCCCYKKLAEEFLKDFKYEYYLDVDLNSNFSLVNFDSDSTVEEICEKNTSILIPEYNWFVSSASLEMSDEELLNYINLIADIPIQVNAKVRMFVISDEYFHTVKENYSKFSYLEESFLFLTTIDKHFNFVLQEKTNKQLTFQIHDIEKVMEEIRDNESFN